MDGRQNDAFSCFTGALKHLRKLNGYGADYARWLSRYNEVKTFIDTNHRNPSRHRIEEHDILNWLKANRKALNAGKMKPERLEMFRRLLSLMEEYKRKNQYE